MGLLWPKCRTWHLTLLKLIQLTLAHRSRLSRSLCRAFLPSIRSTLPPNLVSSGNLLKVHLIPSSRTLIKDHKQNCPQYWALVNTTCVQLPPGFNSILHHSLSLSVQPVFYPLVQAISSKFLQENEVVKGVKGFTKTNKQCNAMNFSFILIILRILYLMTDYPAIISSKTSIISKGLMWHRFSELVTNASSTMHHCLKPPWIQSNYKNLWLGENLATNFATMHFKCSV